LSYLEASFLVCDYPREYVHGVRFSTISTRSLLIASGSGRWERFVVPSPLIDPR
jgi:hypothetical protein